jgi:acyl-CoA dehydrogenase
MRLIGAAERALSLTATRALDRVAFGRPLAAQVRKAAAAAALCVGWVARRKASRTCDMRVSFSSSLCCVVNECVA